MTDSQQRMQLIPKRPPGRSTRKARAFAAEISRLCAEGYTCEAIREALAAVGVQVSKSTVQREAARAGARSRTPRTSALSVVRASPLTPIDVVDGTPAVDTGATASPPAPLRGKVIAEEFMRGRVTNPLLRKDLAP